LLSKFYEMVKKLQLKWNFDFIHKVKSEKIEKRNYIKDITEEELPKLIEEGYIEEWQAKYVKVWEVYEPYMAYLTYVLPWWNDEAELRFWEEMEKKWILKWLQKYWVRKGDILKIKSPYSWYDDRYILF
jgi:hypothetical protein